MVVIMLLALALAPAAVLVLGLPVRSVVAVVAGSDLARILVV